MAQDQSFSPLVHKLNKYMKVVGIAMEHVLSLVEDEITFNNSFFMKSKLCNQLTTHFKLNVCMFLETFIPSLIFLPMKP
jgi:hypothetical protein